MSWQAARSEPVPEAVARLLATVPEWFQLPESNAGYVAAARTKETWTVTDGDAVVGVALVDRHFPRSVELHLLVVDRAYHGTGVGTALTEAVEATLAADGGGLLAVKTLGPSHPDTSYARTRHFYERRGFLPLEETDAMWGPENPCLLLVKPVGQGRPADPRQ